MRYGLILDFVNFKIEVYILLCYVWSSIFMRFLTELFIVCFLGTIKSKLCYLNMISRAALPDLAASNWIIILLWYLRGSMFMGSLTELFMVCFPETIKSKLYYSNVVSRDALPELVASNWIIRDVRDEELIMRDGLILDFVCYESVMCVC